MHLHIDFRVDLQVGFLKHLGDVATMSQFVLFLRVIPDRLDDKIRFLCGARAVVQTKISLDYNYWLNECFEMQTDISY